MGRLRRIAVNRPPALIPTTAALPPEIAGWLRCASAACGHWPINPAAVVEESGPNGTTIHLHINCADAREEG
jgi:hypothetical protein